jgi:DNA-binding helix-hairpin-helix protein with protein kinase domain
MSQLLRPQQIVRTVPSGLPCRVEELLGSGSQGEVYRATLEGKAVALKWYLPAAATAAQRAALELLVKQGPPNDRFLWPIELAETGEPATVPGFGYVMPLREARYRGIIDLMKRRVEPSFRALATAGLELAHSYLQLHARGLCYRDISFGNVFFDPESGEVLICDNDNVAVDGQASAGVLGTPRFMAPEVVRGEALPSTQTDLFSLAVLLFYLFMVHHPLEGAREAAIRCLDLPAMTQLYGTHPIFIFDPADDSNRPVPGYHDNALAFWPIYPQFLRDLFTRAFTEGLRDPQNGRVRESEWRAAMVQLRDALVYCTACGAENFYDADALRARGTPGSCWACGQGLRLPPRIRIGRSVVMLNHDAKLFPHHVDGQRLYDFSHPVATVSRHPRDPSIWGLTNTSAEKWVISSAVGTQEVAPGRSVTLALGTRINFGKVEGEVRV